MKESDNYFPFENMFNLNVISYLYNLVFSMPHQQQEKRKFMW